MSYQALYRAYRPQTFDKVIGQDAVVKTLQNAITNNMISHAYLFCGPRGTGKTSVARIFAKALNCLNIQKNGEPCCECHICKEISESVNPDVVEIDAASNNGVDEIRDIKERVKFLPSGSKYKIYIIDEVHMLSAGAFNALLKILEEPPKHVIFILATTELQKLPATIISRCQRYEFKPLNVGEISNNLKDICAKEGVEISDEAIELIGEVADGGMRDALSILDQTISYGNKEITIDDVNTITGSINGEIMCNLMSYIDSKDTNNALNIINDLIKDGKEVSKIVNGMLLYCRDLMLYKSVGSKQLNKYIYEKEKFQTLALKIANTKIIYFIELLCDIQNRIKYSNSPAIHLEIAVIRMSSINNEELDVIKRMDELETKLIDTNFSSDNIGSVVDNEKVNAIENRLNNVIGELSKFELPTLSKKVNDMEQIVADKINQDLINSSKQNDSSKITELQSELSSKFIELEAKITAIENGKTISNNNEEKESELEKEIETIKDELEAIKYLTSNQNNKNQNVEFNDEINALKKRIESLSVDLINNNNYEEKINLLDQRINDIILNNKNEINCEENVNNINAEKIVVLEEKIKELEKELFELVADKLAKKEDEKLEKPKAVKDLYGQTNIFEFGVEQPSETNANFGDLENDNNEIEKTLEVEEENNKELLCDESVLGGNNSNENVNEIIEEKDYNNNDVTAFASPTNLFDFNIENNIEKTEEINSDNNGTIKEGLFDDSESDEDQNVEQKIVEEDNHDSIDFDPNNVEEYSAEKQDNQETFNEEKNITESTIPNDNIEPVANEVVNQYYDTEKHEEVINKVKSSIVIRSNVEEKEEVNNVQEDIIVLDEPDGPDKFAKYDIKDLEKLLYDAQETNAKNDKARVLGIWANLLRGVDPALYSIAELLSEAKVEAVGDRELVITYENVSKCNEVMRWSFKEQALRLLYTKLGGTYNYLALPLNIWKDKRREYIEQYQMGIKKATLTPIIIRGLNVDEINNGKDDVKDEKIDQTMKMFGESIVKIK